MKPVRWRLPAWCSARSARLILAVVLLGGCAGQQAHRDGLALMAEGRVEAGLAKLSEATEAAPGNTGYRADLLRSREQTVSRLLDAAASERAAGNASAAQAIYARILVIDPDNSRARLGLETLEMDQRHDAALAEAAKRLDAGNTGAAREAIKPVLLENPKNGKALLLQRRIGEREAKQRLVEPALGEQFTRPVTLQLRDANLKMVFEALSRTSGINVLLDKDVRPDLKVSIFVREVSVEDTIDLILLQNQLEKKVIGDNTVFIYPSTPAKLKDYQDLKVRSFHLTNADPKQMLTMIKTLLKTKDIFIHEKTNSIVIRDTPDAIRLAEKMVADQDIAEPEVMLEVEVLEITRSRASQLGIKYPESFTVATPPSVETLSQLRGLSSGGLLVSQLSATLNLKLEDSDTNVLASPRIRVRNREKAKIMIGSRVPVITNAVTPVSPGTPVITGSVQYLDVGLKLEVEPDIHLDNEVVIKVGLDVSSIIREVPNVQSGTLAYEVGTRNASTVLRLKDGETQILAGLISDEDRKVASKIPGLGQIPVIGRLFSSHKDDNSKTEIVLSITPRIVGSARLHDAREVEYWSGTEASLRSSLFNLKPLGSVAVSTTGTATPVARPRTPVPARREVAPAPQSVPASGAVALIWQGPGQAKPGETIRLTLNAQSAQAMNGTELLLSYDPDVFMAIDVVEGGLFRQNDTPSTFSKTIDQTSGQILVEVSGTAPEGMSGTASIVTLVFEATAARPQSQIIVGRMTAVDPAGAELAVTLPQPHLITVAP
ncbi:MAG: type II and III secretion system protein [Thiobacillus sp.]|nr:type II and III secretion system protein [Thiobacillus sp.]